MHPRAVAAVLEARAVRALGAVAASALAAVPLAALLLVALPACTPSAAGPPDLPSAVPHEDAALPLLPIPPPARPYATVVLDGVPHVRQKPDFCGEACAEMALRWKGRAIDQDRVFELSATDPALGRGAYTAELATALRRLDYRIGDVGVQIDAARAGAELEARFGELYDDLARGVPSIVCMHFGDGPGTTEHFRLVVGYDSASDELVYHEPAEDHGAYRRMSRATFLRRWPLKYEPARWTVIRFRLDPAPVPSLAPIAESTGGAALAQHVLALKEKLGAGFSVVLDPPFVIFGDEPPAAVRAHAEHTVHWAAERLKADFFRATPTGPLDVLLFKDAPSYRKHAVALYGEPPDTPYGYYTPAHHALVMNIATGGGTLVHEIVHPFVEVDFPEAPPWLNEGLGSLFEQSGDDRGHIIGYTNWRLPGLQAAIRRHEVPPFEELMRADAHRFYDEDRGTNYSQSRYLCFWLQETDVLPRFYAEFRAAHADDPTGYRTLQKVLGTSDMTAFQVRWEQWVSKLVFP